jgi:hypothetical protein
MDPRRSFCLMAQEIVLFDELLHQLRSACGVPPMCGARWLRGGWPTLSMSDDHELAGVSEDDEESESEDDEHEILAAPVVQECRTHLQKPDSGTKKSDPCAELRTDSQCVVCLDSAPVMMLPACRHVALCRSCAAVVDTSRCPICRKKQSSRPVRVFIV